MPYKMIENRSCRKGELNTPREKCLTLLKGMEIFKNNEIETWHNLPGHSNYQFSSWNRLKNLLSYSKKTRVLSPSVKGGKYLYYTISVNGKRKSIAINKLKILS